MAVHALETGGPGEAGPLMPSDGEPELPLARELRSILGPKARVIWRGAELDLYARDQADIPDSLRKMLIRTTPDVVVQPESVEDVANVVSAAYDLGIPIVPRGAASFPLGGSVPTMGGGGIDLSALRGGRPAMPPRAARRLRPAPKSSEPLLVQFTGTQEALDYANELVGATSPTHILYFDPHRMHTFNRLMEEPFLREAHSLLIHLENGVGAKEAMEIAATRRASIAPRHHGSYLWRAGVFSLRPERLPPAAAGVRP